MSSGGPIETLPLFPELSRRFVVLLESLTPKDWLNPVSAHWRIRDVVAHLVDTSMRRLSRQRDGHSGGTGPANEDYAVLLAYLNRLNAEWVAAMERVSPHVLIDLIRWSDQELLTLLSSLEPTGRAIWPVAWAGETQSENWFDIAREYTEKWHHAQQVFEAAGRSSTIADRALMYPCLDTLMRGLSHGLRSQTPSPGTAVHVCITGAAGGAWTVVRDANRWTLTDAVSDPSTTVTMEQNDAWKVLMKRMTAAEVRAQFESVRVSGNERLGDAILETICVMA